MKQFSNFLLLLFSFLNTNAQSDSIYQTLIAKASLSHLQENYKTAIEYYEHAFQLQQPDALTAYKAAGMYSLDSNADKAFYYLKIALKSGWTEADWLSFDPYLNYLRKSEPDKWKTIEQEAFFQEQQYVQTLQLPALRKEINLMTVNDQKLRYKRVQIRNDSLLEIINQQIMQSDLNNLNKAKDILQKYGWLTISQIGKDGQNNLWLIAQHADRDVRFQQAALHAMEKWKGTAEINPENYAFLYDRVKCNLNYKQLYGTQVIWTNNGEASGFRPITKEEMVDGRRKEIGLQPLQIYALAYGFNYQKVTASKAKQNDFAENTYVQIFMDSAKYYYKRTEFQKTYDSYNTASTFLGGMSNEENFEAAVIFSRIAGINNEGQYKSIALDFLDLLFLRGYLSKARLLKQPAFKTLHKEQRWIEMNKLLN